MCQTFVKSKNWVRNKIMKIVIFYVGVTTRIHQLRRQTSNWGWARWESKYSQEARQTPRQSRERSLTRPSKLLDCHWRTSRREDTRHTYMVARAPGHAPRWAHNRDIIESNNIGYLVVDSIGTTCNLFGQVSRVWARTPTSLEADKYIFCPTLTLTPERCLVPKFSRGDYILVWSPEWTTIRKWQRKISTKSGLDVVHPKPGKRWYSVLSGPAHPVLMSCITCHCSSRR